MVASGYVFPPLGLYLMWRYMDWRQPLKVAVTVAAIILTSVSTYISSTYVMPHVF
jgi:hypothetical protein